MKKIYSVIGSNWGDEGKGRVVDLLSANAIQEGTVLVVLSNGSAQRGHTVIRNGKRHVFSHFGSGMIVGADNYFPANFIVNPFIFEQECLDLDKKEIKKTKCYANSNCRVALVYDMMSNQIIELSRTDKHGSCGCGVWATIQRYEDSSYCNKTLGEIKEMDEKELREYISECAMYSRQATIDTLVSENLVTEIFDKYSELFGSIDTLTAAVKTVQQFLDNIVIVDNSQFLEDFDTVIFENGQGLLLDYDADENLSTPSHTGLKAVQAVLDDGVNYEGIIPEVYYITRTYLTRHGCSEFEGKCEKDDLNPDIVEVTNQTNAFQGEFYYGRLDTESLKRRILNDVKSCNINLKYGLAITHTDDYPADPALRDNGVIPIWLDLN